jgi:hypothetical protein
MAPREDAVTMRAMRDLRRLVSTVVIVSFSFAALLGIIALVGGGSFGETEGRVLLTTVIVGVESVAALCYLGLAGHRLALIGAMGGLVSAAATALALWLTWGGDDSTVLWQAFGVAVTLAASLAQASLLLALLGRRRIGAGLASTLLAIAVVAAMIIIPIVAESAMNDGYWRALGVVAILDVLGTIVLTARGVSRRHAAEETEPRLLTAAVESRLTEAALQRGTSPSELLSDALDAFLAAPHRP